MVVYACHLSTREDETGEVQSHPKIHEILPQKRKEKKTESKLMLIRE